MTFQLSRQEAWDLLTRYNQAEHLIKHALAVETVMRHFAEKFGEDPEKWGIIGLCHDLDYELHPDTHCVVTKKILEEEGWPQDWIRGVMSHGWKLCTDVEPVHIMEKVIYTVDELTGLIMAAALMRPSRSLMDLEVSSVKKKWKDKRFAAGVNREVILEGAEMLGMTIEEVIHETILGLRKNAMALDLA